MENQNNWERRWHPLLQEWVVLAATTSERPWSGETVKSEGEEEPEYDPKCYLCPGVTRASGVKNPEYSKPFAFTNDFASFSPDAPDIHRNQPFERVQPVHGTCRVLCFSPKHNTTLAQMSLNEIADVVNLWKQEFAQLSAMDCVDNVLMFENKGKAIGVSNPHPHGQIYATGFVPKIVAQQRQSFADYFNAHNRHLLNDLLEKELKDGERIIMENEHFVCFIPFFARFVYETYIVPKRQVSRIIDFTEEETEAFTDIFHKTVIKFDNLYQMSFPNITMLQSAPTDDDPRNRFFHFHVEFYPPMRAPDKLKYLAGFESGGGNIINPVMPEIAAKRMREAGTVHFTQNG